MAAVEAVVKLLGVLFAYVFAFLLGGTLFLVFIGFVVVYVVIAVFGEKNKVRSSSEEKSFRIPEDMFIFETDVMYHGVPLYSQVLYRVSDDNDVTSIFAVNTEERDITEEITPQEITRLLDVAQKAREGAEGADDVY